MPAQDLLNRGLQIVVSEQPKNSAEVSECVLVSLQKRLLRRAIVSAVECCATIHAAHREHLQRDWHAVQLSPGFIPNRPELPVPAHNAAERRSCALTMPVPACALSRIGEPSLRPP